MKRSKKKGKEALDEALLKVAVGYSVEEITEEYAEVDGEMKLMKRKETKKDIPPDLKAVQILLADSDTDFSKMSDEDLERERDRLLAELALKKASSADGMGGSFDRIKKECSGVLVGGRYEASEIDGGQQAESTADCEQENRASKSVKSKNASKSTKGKSVIKSAKSKSSGGKVKKSTGKSTVKKNKEAKA